MNFPALKKELLVQAADEFGVEIKPTDGKETIIAALYEDGVTWDMYKTAFPDVEKPEAGVSIDTPDDFKYMAMPKAPTVLLRMHRANATYETRGYRFTKTNPFVPVDEESANYILENEEGFGIASPKEARDFYN